MRLNTQLYIDTSDNTIDEEAKYELVEFFDFENIEITETIKNIEKIDVVFSDYTKSFNVPASKDNNKIFKHYYSTNLINSFDARIKKRAIIYLNGIFFKQGYVRLSSAKIKDGKPYSYELHFFGALSTVSDILGEDKLTDLTYLDKYNHEYNLQNVFNGLTSGLQYNGTDMEEYTNKTRDIVYPLISAQNKWFYDGSGTSADEPYKEGFSVNIYNNDGTGSPDSDYGINYTQLKPAIKVSHIFDAISERYASISFKQDSFVYGSKLKDLYMLMHSRKGTFSQGVGSEDDKVSETFIVRASNGSSSFNLSTGDEELMPIITYIRYEGFTQARNMTDITLNVTIDNPTSGDISYTIELFDGNDILATVDSTNFSEALTYQLTTENLRQWDDLKWVVTSDGSVVEYSVSMELVESYSVRSFSASISYSAWSTNTKTSTYDSIESSYTFPQTVEVYNQMPDMKIIDFLKGITKMFNLVVDLDLDTSEMDLKPLNDYYLSGTERDISDYIDSSNYEVERLQLYGNIEFKFNESTTYGITNHNEVTNDDFGNLNYNMTPNGSNNNFIFDKGTYDVKLPFEKLYFSRLNNEYNGNLTPICESWLAGEDQSPKLTKPILFFNENTSVDTSVFQFGVRGQVRGQAEFIANYNRGSNNNSDASLSLNWGAEKDEFTFVKNENSLFEKYYKPYVANTFNKGSRRIKIDARFPLSFILKYSLADRFLINGSPFIINEITTNLNTGKSELELITAFDIDLEEFVDVTAPADVTGLTKDKVTASSVSVSWNANSETDLAGYKVYVDDVLYTTLGVRTFQKITGLSQSTSYDIKVTAYDEAGNESVLGSATALTITTGAISDVTSPTIPRNVRVTLIGSSGFTVAWDASTDDVGVDSYTFYVDGVAQTPTTTDTFYTVTGLSSNTDYSVTVLASDASGNSSAESSPITVRTITT